MYRIKQLIDELRLNKCQIALNDAGNINLILEDNAKLPEELILKVRENKNELINYIKFSVQSLETGIKKTPYQDSYPLSDAQRRLWVLSKFEGGSVAYNMPGSKNLEGNYDLLLFQKSFNSLIERHEILRTVFKENETGEMRQWILKEEKLDIKIQYEDFRKFKNHKDGVKKDIDADS